MDDRTDEAVIRQVLNGNADAFRYLVERHMKLAYSTAFSVTRNHEDAQEIIQDAFLKAFTALGSFQGKSKFSTWLFRIVYHKALNHAEKTGSYKKNIQLANIQSTDEYMADDNWHALINKDQSLYISKALNLLSPEDRVALSLYYLEEKPQPEIAAITGWSLASAKIRIHRARGRLNEALKKILDTEKDSLL